MHPISRPIDMLAFASAGNAIFTLAGKSSRFTYRMRLSDDSRVFFVSVLTGSDNTNDYTYLGTIKNAEHAQFMHGRKSTITADAPSARAFVWFWDQLTRDGDKIDQVKFYHEGRCGRCARLLTVPESIERGIGPDCAERMFEAA